MKRRNSTGGKGSIDKWMWQKRTTGQMDRQHHRLTNQLRWCSSGVSSLYGQVQCVHLNRSFTWFGMTLFLVALAAVLCWALQDRSSYTSGQGQQIVSVWFGHMNKRAPNFSAPRTPDQTWTPFKLSLHTGKFAIYPASSWFADAGSLSFIPPTTYLIIHIWMFMFVFVCLCVRVENTFEIFQKVCSVAIM